MAFKCFRILHEVTGFCMTSACVCYASFSLVPASTVFVLILRHTPSSARLALFFPTLAPYIMLPKVYI